MHSLMNSVMTGATWVADALDDLVADVISGFGNAAPLIAPGDERPLEDPSAPTP
ncbi:hypothetical protein MKK67_24145 [Methylobacterium sp. J-072]|uniref:hypothetical protein n=1 Tax=Methylobacterium sp. J-072 TaxID=2836651 RepID=UPI001FB9B234|nr:hypothetical protein [Methylobacterium sp. J-072]MCJ2095565.1 hypothetical protein [Methylobacterium sp. J-072]